MDIFDIGEVLRGKERGAYPLYTHPMYKYFSGMLQRAKTYGYEYYFKHERRYFEEFLEIVGPIPKNMKTPTVGRYDHSKGYVFDTEHNRWNFRWQERSENCRDVGLRNKGQLSERFRNGHRNARVRKGFDLATPEQLIEWRRKGWFKD